MVLSGLLLFGCKKEESKDEIHPTIKFITDSGFIFKDTQLKTGANFKIGIICKSGTYNITHFNYTLITEKGKNPVDSGMNNTGFRWEGSFSKGTSKNEIWSFYITDREGNVSDTIRVIISLDSNSVYGKIVTIPELILGAQSSTIYPEFYSLISLQTYNDAQAYQNQSIIDLVYFYDFKSGDNNTIASPGANIDSTLYTAPWPMSGWTIKNTTRFEITTISPAEFNDCKNDSLILAGTFPYASGKRKAKNLAKDHVYSFVSQTGIKGLFLVNDVIGTEAGSINISLKLQDQ
jgi:hypothetical protein